MRFPSAPILIKIEEEEEIKSSLQSRNDIVDDEIGAGQDRRSVSSSGF